MKALLFSGFGPMSGLHFIDVPDPIFEEDTAVVQVVAGSINPSDVKNVEGKMEGTTLPRIPGRDFSGVVVKGPTSWIGKSVWGTGGDIGYTVDGSHAELIGVPVASLSMKPNNLSFAEAATVGTTFIAAWLSLVEYADIREGETLLVVGAAGGVGGAAAQIGRWKRCRVIGADRRTPILDSSDNNPLDLFVLLDEENVAAILYNATGGTGANIVFDTVGGLMFAPALAALAPRGRLVEIASTGQRIVSFDLINFYHNEGQIFGADTRKRDAIASGRLLDAMRPLFETQIFNPPKIDEVIPLSQGQSAYDRVAGGQVKGRLVLSPIPDQARAKTLRVAPRDSANFE